MAATTARQLDLYTSTEEIIPGRRDTSSTFADNLSLPIHRWFRYSAGYSALWVRDLIATQSKLRPTYVLDPFVGSGTTVLEAEQCGCESVGLESHPFVARIARAKLLWRLDPKNFQNFAHKVLDHAIHNVSYPADPPKLLVTCFPRDTLAKLFALRESWNQLNDSSPHSELTWLVIVSIIRQCSPVGTAQWQYVLPKKTKARTLDPFHAFSGRVSLFARDMVHRQSLPHGPRARLSDGDARICDAVPDGWANLIISSPPYANNYDYADATRLEMTFSGEIENWGDLQEKVRKYLIRSCSQHVASISGSTQEIIHDPLLAPVRNELAEVCDQLGTARKHHGGKKTYHTMVAAYFADMAKVWAALRRASAGGALVCFVIGDSAPYGIYVPVDRWLGELAIAAGFKSYHFEKTRDRNIKWKNRKHRVPLHEGRLWIEG